MWSLVTGQCIFDVWYCILVSAFALSYAAYMFRFKFSLTARFHLFSSYLPVFVLPFIPLPFSLPVVRLPLPFSSKNMKMKTIKRFSVRFRPFSTLYERGGGGRRASPCRGDGRRVQRWRPSSVRLGHARASGGIRRACDMASRARPTATAPSASTRGAAWEERGARLGELLRQHGLARRRSSKTPMAVCGATAGELPRRCTGAAASELPRWGMGAAVVHGCGGGARGAVTSQCGSRQTPLAMEVTTAMWAQSPPTLKSAVSSQCEKRRFYLPRVKSRPDFSHRKRFLQNFLLFPR